MKLSMQTRIGRNVEHIVCPRNQNSAQVDAQVAELIDGVGLSVLIEQFDGQRWCVFGGADIPNVALTGQTAHQWHFYEQIVANPGKAQTTRVYTLNGKEFKQYALCSKLRITTESYRLSGEERVPAELDYALNIVLSNRSIPVELLPQFGSR